MVRRVSEGKPLVELDLPMVTVVTVSYQAANLLRDTIASVLRQDYPLLEYWVIDGGSTDGTVALLQEYSPKLRWLSEPDRGIYDAMNKGVSLATGEWILFLNAGDRLADTLVLSNLLQHPAATRAHLIYGQHFADYGTWHRLHVPPPIEHLSWRHVFSHQALLARTELLRQYPFDSRYRYCSDFQFFYTCLRTDKRWLYVPLPVCYYLAGGASDVHAPAAVREREQIVQSADGFCWPRWLYYRCWIGRLLLGGWLKRILPNTWVSRITKWKYRV